MGAHETRTFKSGTNVALRLPKALGVGPGEPILIERHGDVLTVRRAEDPAAAKRKLNDLVETLCRLGRCGEIEERELVEFPQRPGL